MLSFNQIAKVSSVVNSVKVEGAKAKKYIGTIEGSYAELVKFGNKGYLAAIRALGFGCFKDFKKYVDENVITGKLHPDLYTTIEDKKGNAITVPCTWRLKAMVDKKKSAKDINGTLRYAFILDGEGKKVYENVQSHIVRYTADLLLELVTMDLVAKGVIKADEPKAEAQKAEEPKAAKGIKSASLKKAAKGAKAAKAAKVA